MRNYGETSQAEGRESVYAMPGEVWEYPLDIQWIVLGVSDPVSGIPNVTGGAYLSTLML